MRLTTEQKNDVLRLRQSGKTLREIADQFGCTVEGVRQVCKVHGEKRRLETGMRRLLESGIPPTQIRIDQVPMSTRAFTALSQLDVIFISEIPRFTVREFLSLKHTGKRTLREIEDDILAPFGLVLESNG